MGKNMGQGGREEKLRRSCSLEIILMSRRSTALVLRGGGRGKVQRFISNGLRTPQDLQQTSQNAICSLHCGEYGPCNAIAVISSYKYPSTMWQWKPSCIWTVTMCPAQDPHSGRQSQTYNLKVNRLGRPRGDEKASGTLLDWTLPEAAFPQHHQARTRPLVLGDSELG